MLKGCISQQERVDISHENWCSDGIVEHIFICERVWTVLHRRQGPFI
jgi:hypothetical protein